MDAIVTWQVYPEGYTVVAMGSDGAPITDYWAGNSAYDSGANAADPDFAVPIETLERYAEQTANEIAAELRADGYTVLGVDQE